MSSTIGGFLIGIGIMLLLISSSLAYIAKNYYKSAYTEILSYKETVEEIYNITHSPTYNDILDKYKELVDIIPVLEKISENYSTITEYRNEINEAYNITHSEKYNKAITILQQIYTKKEEIIIVLNSLGLNNLSSSLDMVPNLVNYMVKAKQWSETAKNILEIETLLPPEKLREIVYSLKKLTETVPPDKLEKYLYQAKEGSEKALEIIETIEKYPPQKINTYALTSIIVSTIILLTGIILVIKNRKNKIEDTY